MKKLLLLAFILFPLISDAKIYIPIDQPSDKLFPIAVCDLGGIKDAGKEVSSIIRNDMFLSGYFLVLDPSIYENYARKEGVTLEDVKFSYWNMIEAQALVKGTIQKEGDEFVAEIRLFDPAIPQMLIGKKYRAKKGDLRDMAHRFSDEIMEMLTGRRGVFNTKIAYTAITKKNNKDIFIMDMDGARAGQITKGGTINMSPDWSPDGSRIVFTSYMNGNPDLYVMSAGGGGLKQILGNAGSSITPAWSPGGGTIAVSSSIKGDADIYLISPGSKKLTPVIIGNSIDLAPTWSPDGGEIIFASERAGGLHLFKTSAGGGGASRLTFVGYQNDMPSWSPMGDKVAFSGRDMGAFDVFIMNPDGSNIQRLTIGSGNNEHPTWSPDGRWITFSSTRAGGTAVYIMRADGSNQVRVSKGNGMLPAWGPNRK